MEKDAKRWLKPWFLLLLIVSFIAFGLKLTYKDAFSLKGINLLLSAQTSNATNAERQEIVLDYFIDSLATCESNQTPDVKILDSDGYYSYGWLQFHLRTFNMFGEKYGLPHDDILSPAEQIPIAKAMIKEGLWTQWTNCAKSIGLDKFKPL